MYIVNVELRIKREMKEIKKLKEEGNVLGYKKKIDMIRK